MVMENSELDLQDQRKTSSMEHSTAMTIEFLRARLLSERSISRSSRQRADDLAKKVIELEEQLKMVTLQRKMAEKATADVLAILESQGMSDVSDEFELGLDTENLCEYGISNNAARDGDTYVTSKGRRHESVEQSCSDMDSSPSSGRNLSWKGRHESPHSLEKYKNSNFRRQNTFSSISSSPKHRFGKSCRKIRHRQTRSLGEEFKARLMKVSSQEKVVASSELFPNGLDEYGRDKEMEKAFEHQAQLIDQYGEMEKAQRDWEDKFRENNGATPDSSDRGNHADLAEEKDESKVQFPHYAKVANSSTEENKSERTYVRFSEEISEAGDRDNMPKSFDGTGRGYSNQDSTAYTSALSGHENLHTLVKGNQDESSVNYHHHSSDIKHHQDSQVHGYPNNSKQTDSSPTHDYCGLHLNEASRNTNDFYAIVSHEQQSDKFSGVLESLKEARISLQQYLNNKLPLVETDYTSKASNPSAPFCKKEDKFDIPIACPGLFRLPPNFTDEATASFNVHGSTSEFGSNFYRDGRISRTSGGNQHSTNPYPGKMLSLSTDYQSLAIATTTTQYLQNGSIFDSEEHPSVPFNNRGLPSSDKYNNYPAFPIYPTYQNATTPKMPFDDEISRPYSSNTVGDPPRAYNFSFQDQLRSNMYV